MTTPDDGQRMRDLAFSAIPSAWVGMDGQDRDNVIDLLSTYDHVLALQYLVASTSIDPTIAAAIRSVISASPDGSTVATVSGPYDDQELAYDAIPSAWAGLDIDRRQDVIDLLSTFDFQLAFDVLLKSSTMNANIAARIRKRADVLAD